MGIRKPPKPVAPFDTDGAWLPTCAFLDPETLQCRIHDAPEYPEECAEYPGHNLELGAETECERVEDAVGGDRLLDDEPPDEQSGLLFGPQAVGQTVFAYPDPGDLSAGFVDRLEAGELTDEDRARFVAAAASAPTRRPSNRRSASTPTRRPSTPTPGSGERADEEAPKSGLGEAVEDARGAPGTPGWD